MVLLTLLAVTLIGIARTRQLFGVVVMTSIYSFLIASILIVLDAVDVAMTEAAVGAGISAVLLLGTLYLTRSSEVKSVRPMAVPLFVAGVTAAALIFGTADLPPFGSPDNTVQVMGPDYMARSVPDTGIPNVVTSTLASYRGFDTLGETSVIFTAGIAVLALLRRTRRKPEAGGKD